jgi:GNAT superfamily N-acetyltransferase
VDASDDAAALRAVLASPPPSRSGAVMQPRDVLRAQHAAGKEHLTLLMRACKAGRLACVRALLSGELGADVNAVAERSRYTALSLAVYAHGGNGALVDCLLDAGADPTHMNRYGESVIRVAEMRGHAALAARLRQRAEEVGGAQGGPAGRGRLPAAPSPPVLRALGPSALPVTFRPVSPSDQAALVALYCDGQQLYKRGPLAPAHEAWLATVLATDFRDAAGHYGSIPRAQLWVATLPLAAVAAAFDGALAPTAAATTAPAAPTAAGGAASGGSGIPRKAAPGGVPRKGSGASSAPAAAATRAPPELEGFVDASNTCVVVGCVAVIPTLLPSSAADAATATQWSSEAVALQTADPHTSRVAELQRMCVHSRLRRCGLATALLQHAEVWAAASGYTHVVLSTLASMAPAVALYPARGYAPSGPAGGAPMDYHGCAIRVVTFERRL